VSGLRRPVSELREHPCVDLVPAMSGEEFARLVADVGEQGLLEPLKIRPDGVVLDGQHRLRAVRQLGWEQVPVRLVEPENELQFMVRSAVLRRQLNESQRAAVAVEWAGYETEQRLGLQRRKANLRHSPLDVAELPHRAGRTRDRYAKLVGVSPRLLQNAQLIRGEAPDLFQQIKAGQLSVTKAVTELKRRQRYAQIGGAPPLPKGPFDLIYADPPWQLDNPASTYAPEQYYPTLPLEQLKQLDVPAAEDSLLYLWAVNSHLPQAWELMSAWGFSYCGNEVWVKHRLAMGVWTRYRHELVLIGRRGSASPPEPKLRLDSVIEAPLRGHSQKPVCVYERLEHLYPRLSKVELFARGRPRPGWTFWGNQVEEAA
jgi:N6-adenosine-specific RNA methylase IME4/ParB-like chromosome segregation protein Spo0J